MLLRSHSVPTKLRNAANLKPMTFDEDCTRNCEHGDLSELQSGAVGVPGRGAIRARRSPRSLSAYCDGHGVPRDPHPRCGITISVRGSVTATRFGEALCTAVAISHAGPDRACVSQSAPPSAPLAEQLCPPSR